MAYFLNPSKLCLVYFCLFYYFTCFNNNNNNNSVEAQIDESSFQIMMSNALEWPSTTTAISLGDEEFNDGGEEDEEVSIGRRSLFWKTMHYYISYGALSANRVPCPPRSGRSYYTHNCYRARGPVHPYSRGCSRITRCRR